LYDLDTFIKWYEWSFVDAVQVEYQCNDRLPFKLPENHFDGFDKQVSNSHVVYYFIKQPKPSIWYIPVITSTQEMERRGS
jgi:hypothetical protein